MLELLLPAALGGVVEALAGQALEGTVARIAGRLGDGFGRGSATRAAEAVRRAVEAARQQIRDEHFSGDEAASRELVTLLDHPPFAEEVTRRLLVRGQPDFARLRRFYLEDDATTSERWEALLEPLADFIDAIESQLTADPELGELLRHNRRLAELEGMALAYRRFQALTRTRDGPSSA